MASIIVLDGFGINPGDNPWSALAAQGELTVHERSTAAQTLARVEPAEIVLTNKVVLDAAVLDAAPKLRGICVLATGVNVVELAAASARGIPVSNIPAYSTDSVVQHTIALLLELCHHVGRHDASVHRGDWVRAPDFSYRLSSINELAGKVLGIVGYGAIGRRVADAARGLGMKVCAARLSPTAATNQDGPERLSLDELFRVSDVISLHCPLTEQTTEVVSRERLALMKSSALLVNTARGGLVDERALADALDSGQIAGAALDVLSREPPLPDNPLLLAKNCVITPHIAWTSLPSRERLMAVAVDNVRALLAGSPIHLANPDYAAARS